MNKFVTSTFKASLWLALQIMILLSLLWNHYFAGFAMMLMIFSLIKVYRIKRNKNKHTI